MKHLFFFTLISFCSILTIAQPTAGLVGYWKKDGNFNDAGPYAIHGSNFGSTATTNYAAVAIKAMLFLYPSTNTTTVAQSWLAAFYLQNQMRSLAENMVHFFCQFISLLQQGKNYRYYNLMKPFIHG